MCGTWVGPVGSVPQVRRYYEALRLPAVRPASLRSPSARGYRRAPMGSLRSGPRCAPRRPGELPSASPTWPLPSTETTGPPRFLGNPFVHVPRSSTPVGRERSTDYRVPDAAFRITKGVGPTTRYAFGALSRSPRTRCLRFARRVTPDGHKTRFRLPSRLGRTGLATRWVPLRGFIRSSESPSSRLGLAHS